MLTDVIMFNAAVHVVTLCVLKKPWQWGIDFRISTVYVSGGAIFPDGGVLLFDFLTAPVSDCRLDVSPTHFRTSVFFLSLIEWLTSFANGAFDATNMFNMTFNFMRVPL